MNIIKKYQFWLSVIFAIICFIALYPLSAIPMAYYVLGFVAISIIGFALVLYHLLTKSFTQTNAIRLVWIVAISALPHVLLVVLTYGSWVCLGGAIIIVAALLLSKKKFPRQ